MKRRHLFLVSDEEFQGFQEGRSIRFVAGEDEYEIRRETPARASNYRVSPAGSGWAKLEAYLRGHPNMTAIDLAEVTGIPQVSVRSFLYRREKRGDAKKSRSKKWRLV